MAEFSVPIVEVVGVEPHPNADRLMLVKVLGYTCISNKDENGNARYKVGDRVAYIPANAVLPEQVLRKLNLWDEEKGCGVSLLSGPDNNRVKATKLRGVFSEGLIYPVEVGEVGDNIAEKLGITKWEPPIPAHMVGEVFNLGYSPVTFDLEPIEKHPNAFAEGDEVVITEKLHGTMCGFGIIFGLNHPEAFMCPWGSRDLVIWSKGLGAKGLMFKDVPTNEKNLYVKVVTNLLRDNKGFWKWMISDYEHGDIEPCFFLGEIVGKKIQDLEYGLTNPNFKLFDIVYNKLFQNFGLVKFDANIYNLDVVPILYEGPFKGELIPALRDGMSTLCPEHIREGVVIRTRGANRVAYKAVSPAYKLRKNGTELT